MNRRKYRACLVGILVFAVVLGIFLCAGRNRDQEVPADGMLVWEMNQTAPADGVPVWEMNQTTPADGMPV